MLKLQYLQCQFKSSIIDTMKKKKKENEKKEQGLLIGQLITKQDMNAAFT